MAFKIWKWLCCGCFSSPPRSPPVVGATREDANVKKAAQQPQVEQQPREQQPRPAAPVAVATPAPAAPTPQPQAPPPAAVVTPTPATAPRLPQTYDAHLANLNTAVAQLESDTDTDAALERVDKAITELVESERMHGEDVYRKSGKAAALAWRKEARESREEVVARVEIVRASRYKKTEA